MLAHAWLLIVYPANEVAFQPANWVLYTQLMYIPQDIFEHLPFQQRLDEDEKKEVGELLKLKEALAAA